MSYDPNQYNSSDRDDVNRVDQEGVNDTNIITNPVKDILSLFLCQVILILVICRLVAKLLAKLRQPPVIGEILAGVILGPSVLGYIPGFESNLFPAYSLATLQIFAQVGLIFFMFFLGLELDPSLFTRYYKSAGPIAVVSVLVPFSLGCALSPLLYPVEATSASHSTYTLFMGTSLAFTAFPLLARILTAFRLLGTPFGEHVLSIAAIDDVLAWCTLALTLSYAGGATAANGVYTALITIAYLLVLVFITRPCLLWLSRQLRFQQKVTGELNRDYVCILLLCLCASAIWTEISGIHAFFGAFTFGLIVPKDKPEVGESVVDLLAPKIELIIVEFFLPLYFAYSGLRTTLGALNDGKSWGLAILIILVASVGKMIPVTIMTRLMTRYWKMGDDFEQEDLDYEEELRQREEKQVQEAADGSGGKLPDVELGKIGVEKDFSYQQYSTPAHHKKVAAGEEDEVKESATGSSDEPVSSAPDSPHSPSFASSDGPRSPGHVSSPVRSNSYGWRTCLSVGLLMNTTGLVTLIALNIGLDRKILGPKVFSMLVLMALVTTFMTSPFFHYLFYVPFVYQRNLLRERRHKDRQEADGVPRSAEEVEEEAAREAEEHKQAEEDSADMSISSRIKRKLQSKRGVTLNAPFSTNQSMHHILQPANPPGVRASNSSERMDELRVHATIAESVAPSESSDRYTIGVRSSSDDNLNGNSVASDGGVYSNKAE